MTLKVWLQMIREPCGASTGIVKGVSHIVAHGRDSRMLQVDQATLKKLRLENEELKERIRQLEERDVHKRRLFPKEWGLTRTEKRILELLTKRMEPLSRDRMWEVFYGGFTNRQADPNIFGVYIHRLRRKLERFGIIIETAWGDGYLLTRESRHIIAEARACLEQQS